MKIVLEYFKNKQFQQSFKLQFAMLYNFILNIIIFKIINKYHKIANNDLISIYKAF